MSNGGGTAATRDADTTLAQSQSKGRITVLGPVQGIRPTYPDPKKGGLITDLFCKKYNASSSEPPNEAACKVGHGQHKYGKLILPLKEEPCYTDFGKNASKGGGTALVIGNKSYDLSKKMGSTALQNRVVDMAKADADKIESTLKSKGFAVTKLYDQKGDEITKALENKLSSIQNGKCFFFYFCGHGTFDGLIGIDGAATSPAELVKLIPKSIEVECDLVIVLDACNQGCVVDASRMVLFDYSSKRNSTRPKLQAFIEAAKKVAVAKNEFTQQIRSLLEEQWKVEDVTVDMDLVKWEELYNKRGDVWNNFLDKVQPLLNEAVNLRNIVKPGLAKLALKKTKIKGLNQDDEVEIWAQLDSIDIILEQAVGGKLVALK